MGQSQRQPRVDQLRDKDAIRRYEIGTDIDGDETVIHIDENVLTLHERSDTELLNPKFKFVFRDGGDMLRFLNKAWCEAFKENGRVTETEL